MAQTHIWHADFHMLDGLLLDGSRKRSNIEQVVLLSTNQRIYYLSIRSKLETTNSPFSTIMLPYILLKNGFVILFLI